MTNGDGIGVLATDAQMDYGRQWAELSSKTKNDLKKVLPPTWSHANPVNIIGDAPGIIPAAGRYAEGRRVGFLGVTVYAKEAPPRH